MEIRQEKLLLLEAAIQKTVLICKIVVLKKFVKFSTIQLQWSTSKVFNSLKENGFTKEGSFGMSTLRDAESFHSSSKEHLGPCQISMMEPFRDNSLQLLTVKSFCTKAPS